MPTPTIVEKPIYIDQPIYIDRPVEIEKIVEVPVEIPVEYPVYIDKPVVEEEFLIKDENIIYSFLKINAIQEKQKLKEEEITFGFNLKEDELFKEKWNDELNHLKRIIKQIENSNNKNLVLEEKIKKIKKKIGDL